MKYLSMNVPTVRSFDDDSALLMVAALISRDHPRRKRSSYTYINKHIRTPSPAFDASARAFICVPRVAYAPLIQ